MREGRRRRRLGRIPSRVALALLVVGASVCLSAGTAGATSYYCGTLVFPKYDCASMSLPSAFGQYVFVGYFNNNHAYRPGGGSTSVCEHTYIYGGGTVSRRCAGGYIQSYCDLYYYYNNGYVLSGHAGNNDGSNTYKIDGHAVVDNPQQQCA